MATIRIYDEEVYDNTSYKERVLGGENDFDQTFVIKGNRGFIGCAEADWYKKATTMLDQLDCYYEYEEWKDLYKDELSEEQAAQIKKLYDECVSTEQIICKVLNIIYPEANYQKHVIRGYCQGDWQEVICNDKEVSSEVLDYLEAYYFGKYSEVSYEEENVYDTITHDELWKYQREGKLKEELRQMFDIDKDEELTVYQSDGYVKQIKWKEVV